MATDHDYREYITRHGAIALVALLDALHGAHEAIPEGFDRGRVFEHLVIRAFELEVGPASTALSCVRYPYTVSIAAVLRASGLDLPSTAFEQIDGAVHVAGLSCVCECKTGATVDSGDIGKLRYRLARRPSAAIGAVFALHEFTEPARLEATLAAPQTVLLWERSQLRHAIEEKRMVDTLVRKFRYAVEYGAPDWELPPEQETIGAGAEAG